jgi:peptide deformylase
VAAEAPYAWNKEFKETIMALLPILIIPDPLLRQVAEPVETVTDTHLKLIKDMFETMYDAPGVGLAATQLGIMERIIVVDAAKRKSEGAGQVPGEGEGAEPAEEPDPIAMFNPEILWASEETKFHEEGCLSIPDYYEEVERPDRVRIRYMSEQGETVERDCDGFLAVVVQHEIDHLNGKLFIDHISRLKRDRITKKFQKAAKRAG